MANVMGRVGISAGVLQGGDSRTAMGPDFRVGEKKADTGFILGPGPPPGVHLPPLWVSVNEGEDLIWEGSFRSVTTFGELAVIPNSTRGGAAPPGVGNLWAAIATGLDHPVGWKG